jgi:GATA-binding protein
MFDGVLHGADAFHSPSLPSLHLRQPSPGSTSSINGSHLEPPLSYDALAAQNTSLRTRVNELELVNNLFRDRVTELETSEQEARRVEQTTRETEAQLRAELEVTRQREADLKRRLDEIEGEGPRHKKMRLSDLVDESRAGSPVNPMATE